jgi:peptidyl-prolyl cis-trans isomerase SurA
MHLTLWIFIKDMNLKKLVRKIRALRQNIIYSLLITLVLTISGCGGNEPKPRYTDQQLKNIPQPEVASLPQPSGGLVLAINGETVEAERIITAGVAGTGEAAKNNSYEQFAEGVYPHIKQMLIDEVSSVLLYQKAKGSIPETVFEENGPLDKAVDTEIRRYLAKYENNYSLAQRELERIGFDWKSYRVFQRKQLLAQMYFGKNIEREPEIPYKDMLAFYQENKEEEFRREPKTQFLLIDIRKNDDPAGAMETAAKALAQIKEGEDFAECVAQYSQGIKAKLGGLWETSDPSSLISPYDQVVEKFDRMKEGEVSEIIDTGEHLFIVKLIEHTKAGYIPFSSVQQRIERYLQNLKRKEQTNELIAELFEEADITGLEGFLQYCIRQIYIRGRQG